ncbi:MAG: tetratricopeptide repeat protein [Cyanobacteria bacterium P01_G01_bin.54]
MTDHVNPNSAPFPAPPLNFPQLLGQYHRALDALMEAEPTVEQVAAVLTVRDAIHRQLPQQAPLSPADLAQLTAGDQRLKESQAAIATVGLLDQWQETLQPTPEQWWWFVKAASKVDVWERFDWLWNILTVVGLAGFVANMTSVIPLLFVSGLGFLESLGLVAPGGLMALIAAQMGKGQKSVSALRYVLQSLGIPDRFQSEFASLLAFILFVGAYAAKENLPDYYFNHFVQKGQGFYQQGELRKAQSAYKKALTFAEDESIKNIGKVYADLGIISEAINDYEVALDHYLQALNDDEFDVLNNLGRVFLNQDKLVQAEAVLNMGLLRSDPTNANTQYQFHRNLGWVYLKQDRHDAAHQILDRAIAYQKKVPKTELGYGIAYCLKAATYQTQETPQLDQAAQQWQQCQRHARPETLTEYETIVRHNPDLASKIDTFTIFD